MGELGTLITPRDGLFHRPVFAEPSWCETHWFSFLVPERNLRGHVYVAFRPNLGVVFSHVLLWSRDCATQLDYDYYDSRIHLPMPNSNLDHYRLGNGLEVKTVAPHECYQITYSGFNDLTLECEAVAMMPAVDSRETKLPRTGKPFAHFHTIKSMLSDEVGHIDQTFMVRGVVTLNGEEIEIAYPSNHDHSWSPRPEYGHGRGYFDEGYFGEEGQSFAFHVQTDDETISNGYVIDNGELQALKAGEAWYDRDGRFTRKLTYELEDARGKTHRISGEPTAALIYPTFPNQFNMLSVVKWDYDGEEGWGEYKWHSEVSLLHAEQASKRVDELT